MINQWLRKTELCSEPTRWNGCGWEQYITHYITTRISPATRMMKYLQYINSFMLLNQCHKAPLFAPAIVMPGGMVYDVFSCHHQPWSGLHRGGGFGHWQSSCVGEPRAKSTVQGRKLCSRVTVRPYIGVQAEELIHNGGKTIFHGDVKVYSSGIMIAFFCVLEIFSRTCMHMRPVCCMWIWCEWM